VHCRHPNGDRCSIFVTECHRYRPGRRRSAQYPDQRRRTNWAGPRPKPGRRRKQPEGSGPPSASSPCRGRRTGATASRKSHRAGRHRWIGRGGGTPGRGSSPTSTVGRRYGTGSGARPRRRPDASSPWRERHGQPTRRPALVLIRAPWPATVAFDPASSGREGPLQMLPSRRRRRMVGGAWRERSDRGSRQSAFRPVDNVPIPAGGCNAV